MVTSTNKLYLRFGTSEGKKSSIFLNDPKPDLDSETVTASMQALLDTNSFGNAEKLYTAIDSAYVVETVKTTLV